MTLLPKFKWTAVLAMLTTATTLFAQSNQQETNRAPVLLVAGQSNTDGRVPNPDLPDYLTAYREANGGHYKYAQWCYGSMDHIQTRDSLTGSLFAPYRPFVAKEDNHERHGYDAYLYYLLEQEWQQPFYVVKWSLGGTAIHPKASSTNGKHWCAMPEYLAENQSTLNGGKSLLKSFIEELDLCIDGPLKQLQQGYDIKAMVWHQGESDYRHGNDYYEQLRTVVLYIRQHLVEKTGNPHMADLPFICGTVSSLNRCYSKELEDGMYQLQNDLKNFYVIDMHNAALQRDKLHFTASSAEELGKKMFEKMKELGATNLK